MLRRVRWRLVLGLGLILAGTSWWGRVGSEGKKVVFCNVGQGDGILVMEGRQQLVIDVGRENGEMTRCLGRFMPMWDKKIEVVVITHEDVDHVGGLGQVMRHYQIERLMGGRREGSEQINYSDFLLNFDIVRLGEMVFEVVSPSVGAGPIGENDNSIVGVLTFGGNKFLMMGDAGREVEERLVWRGVLRQDYGTLNYLKVSHHGSEGGTSKTLLEEIEPKVAIISVGKNSFGHPSEEVLERLREKGVEIRRTDEEGDVIIRVD